MLFEVKEVDRRFFAEQLADFLPSRLIDIHTHVWLTSFLEPAAADERGATWPSRVAEDNAIEDLFETYRLMFPNRRVMPLVFGFPDRRIALDKTNAYAAEAAEKHGLPSLIVSTPTWSADELERRVEMGGFLGLKPYLSFAPEHLPSSEITIFDFLPEEHLALANDHGWVVMLHIPRPGRLKDPVNLEQLAEIENHYPDLHLIVAHIGRAYCAGDVGNAFDLLRATERMCFDFCANTNAWVIEQAIRTFGPRRILFGSDLPILRMRMRRICEEGRDINLVPPGLYGDVSDDAHMREVSAAEGEKLTFFMYEELAAFRRAAEAVGLGPADVEDICHNNALRLLTEAGWKARGGIDAA